MPDQNGNEQIPEQYNKKHPQTQQYVQNRTCTAACQYRGQAGVKQGVFRVQQAGEQTHQNMMPPAACRSARGTDSLLGVVTGRLQKFHAQVQQIQASSTLKQQKERAAGTHPGNTRQRQADIYAVGQGDACASSTCYPARSEEHTSELQTREK